MLDHEREDFRRKRIVARIIRTEELIVTLREHLRLVQQQAIAEIEEDLAIETYPYIREYLLKELERVRTMCPELDVA